MSSARVITTVSSTESGYGDAAGQGGKTFKRRAALSSKGTSGGFLK
jgi:hypothetical protein